MPAYPCGWSEQPEVSRPTAASTALIPGPLAVQIPVEPGVHNLGASYGRGTYVNYM